MKYLVELSAADLETLRMMKPMSKRFPKRYRNAETPEELLDKIGAGICEKFDEDMAKQRDIEEWKMPYIGILLVAGIIAGIFALIGLVDFVWRLLTR